MGPIGGPVGCPYVPGWERVSRRAREPTDRTSAIAAECIPVDDPEPSRSLVDPRASSELVEPKATPRFFDSESSLIPWARGRITSVARAAGGARGRMVGDIGLEPTTSTMST
jgi:hypothetical protein